MRLGADLPKPFWGDALICANYVCNRWPNAVLDGKTPFEALFGRRSSVKHLRTFGCICYVNVTLDDRAKDDPSSKKGIFIGYSDMSKGYRVFIPSTKKVITSRDVLFDEGNIPKDDAYDDVVIRSNTLDLDDHDGVDDVIEDDDGSSSSTNPRRTPREKTTPSRLTYDGKGKQIVDDANYAFLTSFDEPTCVEEASQREEWIQAMDLEYQALMKNQTWRLVDLPQGKKAIGCKWIFKVKTNQDGSISKYKARLVAKGYAQEYGIDYEETFAPVAKMVSIRILISLAILYGWELWKMDVSNAFLNGDLDEVIYME